MPEVSIANYAELKERVEKRIKYSGQFSDSLIGAWFSEIIFDIERTVPLQYTQETQEFELEVGKNKVPLPQLIYGKDHDYEVSIGFNLPDAPPCPIVRLPVLKAGDDREYSSDDYGIPGCYYPISVTVPIGAIPEDGSIQQHRRVPGIMLLPPPNEEATKVYILGYFHTVLSDWQDEDTHWLLVNYPEIITAGICWKANVSLRQNEAAALEEREYLRALLGDNDTGKAGLLQSMRALKLPEKANMRMRMAPGIANAREIGAPDYLHHESQYYDAYYDYENERYGRVY